MASISDDLQMDDIIAFSGDEVSKDYDSQLIRLECCLTVCI